MEESGGGLLLLSFHRELEHILKSSKKHMSNRLFSLLSKYETKLSKSVYQYQLLKLGDELSRMKCYNLAINHGYGRYLRTIVTDPSNVLLTINESKTENQLTLTLRAVIGIGCCQYYAVICADELFKTLTESKSRCFNFTVAEILLLKLLCLHFLATRELGVAILQNMEYCLQAGLQYGNLYWLVYNAVTLSYCIARMLLSINLHKHVLKPLLWSCVAMESCIPLLTVKYLPLRATLYCAVCASYYALQQPAQAELFARRSLDKIHQMAQIESLTNSNILSSNKIFTEATLKLGIMVFKRSVLETHKKTKSVLRPKFRPTIKDLIQSNWPRSSTEKLLDEMFNGHSAHYLAILETLSISVLRPFDRKQPQPVTELDDDTITDVYQELMTAGVDLSLKALELGETNESLLNLAVQGSDSIPIASIVKFIHLCYQLDSIEVVSILAQTVVSLPSDCVVSIKILLAVDQIRELIKQGTEDKKIWDSSVSLLDFICTVPFDNPVTRSILFDSSLIVWERICDTYKGLISSNSSCFRSLLSSSKFLDLLKKMIVLFSGVSLPFFDPLLYCEVILKYILLLEAYVGLPVSATNKHHDGASCVSYDRSQLLSCLEIVENSLKNVSSVIKSGTFATNVLIQCHTELFNALWRLKTKLASTALPECPTESFKKPSMLPHMVKQRQQKLKAWQEIASSVDTSSPIPTEANLRDECGVDRQQISLLLINLAMHFPQEKQLHFLKDAIAHLSSLKNESAYPTSTLSVPCAPILLEQSSTEMTFIPAPFDAADVAYFALYGCIATSNNSKVRLSDCHFPGLGIEVVAQTGCTLHVSGLQPYSKYIFAVAAYGMQGQLIGDNIGLSTKPILASYPLSDCLIWGLVSQTAFQLNNFALAVQSSDVLWNYFVDQQDVGRSSLPQYCLKEKIVEESPLPLLHLFTTSVLICVQASIKDCDICPTSTFQSILSFESRRMNLIERLCIALKVSAKINDHSLSLQIVVLLYVLLVPFMQHFIFNYHLIEILLLCHAVLQELPDNLLTSKSTISGIHHMISSLSFCLVKFVTSFNESSLASTLAENSRFLLTLTLPSTVSHRISSANASLQNPSLLSSTSTALTSTISFASQSSVIPQTIDKSYRQQRRKRRKALTLSDDIPDEAKSLQYKALGAYYMCTLEMKAIEELDLTGQEDPVFLHIAIKSLPVQAAYKEVLKFKRRPQYLEYFVHLCGRVMKEGKGDLICNWSSDVFLWLSKRNEILLSTKASQIHKSDQPKEPSLPSKNPIAQTAGPSGSSRQQHCLSSESSSRKAITSAGTSRSKSVQKAETCLAVLKQRITRDDLGAKAIAVLQSLLPSLWRASHCRRRLRLACIEEHSWRAQANILLASCLLDRLCNSFKNDLSFKYSRLDVNGYFLEEMLLPYPPCMPSHERNDIQERNDDHVVKLLNQMFMCYQRASVLSSRGECWVLLVNACRGLWNGLTILHNFVSKTSTCTLSLSQLYGLSLKALYMQSLMLTDMHLYVENGGNIHISNQRLYSIRFLKQFVLLATHVSFVNHHWEKVLALSEKFLSVIDVSDLLNPVIVKARQQLAQRIKTHSRHFQQKPIDPAAHLDVLGYDLYDKVGHSLGMTNVCLSNDVNESASSNGAACIAKESGEVLFLQAHELLTKLLNKHRISDTVVPLADIKDIFDKYHEAFDRLVGANRINLAVQCLFIMGNLMYMTGQLKLACYWWKLGLKKVLKCENPTNEWKRLSGCKLDESSCIIGGVLSSHIAKYVCTTEINVRLEYILLAAVLFKNFVQHHSLLAPEKDISFIGFNITIGNKLEHKVFNFIDASCLLFSLQFIAKELVYSHYSLEVLPIVCFYEYVAYNCARCVEHTVLARLLKLQSLVQLGFFSTAFKLLLNLMTGNYLPQLVCEFNFNISNINISSEFDDQSFINSNQNLKFLSLLTEKQIPISLKEVYSSYSYYELILCKALMFIKLAAMHKDIPEFGLRKIQLVGNTTVSDVKAVLLSNSEKLLYDLINDKTCAQHFTIYVRSHQLLVEISLSLCQGLAATQISLATLRVMQETSNNFDLRMWLHSRLLLLKSLLQILPCQDNPLVFMEFFSVASKECVLYGDYETSCHLLFTSAFYHYIVQPPAVEEVTSFVQSCIDLLNCCQILSSSAKYVKVNAMLLMAEIMSRSTSLEKMKTIYMGIIKILNIQLQEISNDGTSCLCLDNCYKYQLPLFVEAHWRLIQLDIADGTNLSSVKLLLEKVTAVAKHSAMSCNSMLSTLAFANASLFVRNDCNEASSSSILAEALSYALPFDYYLLCKIYCLFAKEMSSHGYSFENNCLLSAKSEHVYHGWCALKYSVHIHDKLEKLQHLTSDSYSNRTTALPTNIDIPAVLLDLSNIAPALEGLITNTDVPSLDKLLPFSQKCTSGISWFCLLANFQHFLKHCFLAKSDPFGHLHHFSSTLLPKAKLLFNFLSSNCPNFHLCIPEKSFMLIIQHISDTDSEPKCVSDLCLKAGEKEVTILWISDTNKVQGFVGLNGKAVHSFDPSASVQAMEIELYSFRTTQSKLCKLRTMWCDLASDCASYLTQQALRPLSRSPSRMRQRALEQSKQVPPSDLTEAINTAVGLLLDTFDLPNALQNLLHVEAHMVSSISQALRPAVVTTEKGEAYHFFKSILSGKSNTFKTSKHKDY